MGSLNKVLLIGNLGKDPDLQYTPSGMAIAKFPLATSEMIADKNTEEKKEVTTWHNVTLFGKMAENLTNYLSKGKQVFIDGRIRNSSYDDKEGITRYRTEIIANNVVLLGKKDDSPQGGQDEEYQEKPQGQKTNNGNGASVRRPEAQSGQKYQPAPAGNPYDQDDDIPF
ncbi:MAG: single-stranded DNA-binding protein [bacterium]